MSSYKTLLQAFATTHEGQLFASSILKRFDANIHNIENLPKGGCLLVGNHSFMAVDSFALSALLIKNTHRAPRYLVERNLFKIPNSKYFFNAVGAIPGEPTSAVKLLEQGEMVCVYPGGVDDTFKPSEEAYLLKWKNRLGFAKVAIKAKVPIIPIAATGIDEMFKITGKETRIGRRLLGSSRYDFPKLANYIPKRIPLNFYILPAVDTSGDPENETDLRRVRQDTQTSIESILGPFREEFLKRWNEK